MFEKELDIKRPIFANQSCGGAPRCKQRGMFAPPLWFYGY